MSRFAYTTNNFYSTISHSRPATSDIKGARPRIVSTGETFLPKNTISNFRPQTSGVMIRSSSSSFRNTKGKLDTLGQQLELLLENTKQTRNIQREMQLKVEFLRKELNQHGIQPMRQELMQSVKLLDKSIQIKKRSDLLKFETLHQTCSALNRNSRELRSKMNHLNERLQGIENLLGFHGVRDKLKY